MQSLLYLNLLPLILILVLCISLISFSYTDLDSSRLLHSVTASDLANLSISKVLYRTVLYSDMAPKTRISRRKRSIAALGREETSRESEIDCNNELQESNEVLRSDGVNAKKKLCIGVETENIIGVSVEYNDLIMGGGIEAVQPQTVTNNCKKTRRRIMTTSVHYMVFKNLNRKVKSMPHGNNMEINEVKIQVIRRSLIQAPPPPRHVVIRPPTPSGGGG